MRRTVSSGRRLRSVALLLLIIVAACWAGTSRADAATPTVTISPAGPYHDGESVTVSIGPNSVFTPNTRVNILECADPGGTPAGLPSSDKSCDGQTIQNGTLYVGSNGAVNESGYVLYALPNRTVLEEAASSEPTCNTSNACALFVGVSQNDFGQAHLFSSSFSIATAPLTSTSATSSSPNGGAGSATTSNSGTTTSPASTGDPSAAVTLGTGNAGSSAASSGSLAFTGVPPTLPRMVLLGSVLMAAGSIARRRLRHHRFLWGKP